MIFPNLQSQPPSPADQLGISGYPALLADYCQLSDQVSNLVVTVMALWESHNRLLRMLDLPSIPLPIAGSLAVAARPAGRTMSALAGEES